MHSITVFVPVFILFIIYATYHVLRVSLIKNNIESMESQSNSNSAAQIVIARYNEDLQWLREEPFNEYDYVIYNKGDNKSYYKSSRCLDEIDLPNVGRETHTYLTHIINYYDDNSLASFTFFVPGSLELEHKHDRAKTLFETFSYSPATDLFACNMLADPVREVFNDFVIDSYVSSNEKNKTLNTAASMKMADIRPYGQWFDKKFEGANRDSKCFPVNAIFGLTKETIMKKPKSYYENLLKEVDHHHNHESGHFFERAWETVFYPYENVKYTS